MKHSSRLLAFLSVFALAACGGTSAPSTAPASAAAKPSTSAASPASGSAAAKPAGSAAASGSGLEALTAAAKQEGKLTVGFSPNPPLHDIIIPAFEKQYGIQVEQVSQQATALAQKMIQEKAAGQKASLDVYLGATSAVPIAYDAKLYTPIKPLLTIPDIGDSSKWIGGKVTYMDKEEQNVVRMDRQVRPMVSVNPDIVKPEDLKTPEDLLDPKYKGKIAAFDPLSPGAGQSVAAVILKLKGPDFLKKLYIDQQVKFTTEQRILGDWVAHGTYPIAIALPVDEAVSIKNNGLPVARAKPGDMTATITSVLLWGVMDGAQHPAAAKLFVNWVMTKDGMQQFVTNMQTAVIRTDMDYSKMNPDDVPGADAKYFDEGTWDYVTGEKNQLLDQLKTLIPKQ